MCNDKIQLQNTKTSSILLRGMSVMKFMMRSLKGNLQAKGPLNPVLWISRLGGGFVKSFGQDNANASAE
jgi:hypothetical protein